MDGGGGGKRDLENKAFVDSCFISFCQLQSTTAVYNEVSSLA